MTDHHTPIPTRAAVLTAEVAGTFLLVLGLVSAALFASAEPDVGIGWLGVALAIGIAVVAGAYAFGPLSGGHFNPAVTLGVAAAGRLPWRAVPGYVAAQLVGGALATTVIALVAASGPGGLLGDLRDAGFASNGWGALSPGGFGFGAMVVVELVFTAVFVTVILGVTHPERGNPAMAGLVIGLTLTLIHLATIPVDNTSVNPARSLAAALFGGGDALGQVWAFFVFPPLGALAAGFAYRALFDGVRR